MQYRERIIFLGKAIDEETGNQLVATMLYLDSENKKDLNLYINCSGGDVSSFVTCIPCVVCGFKQVTNHTLHCQHHLSFLHEL